MLSFNLVPVDMRVPGQYIEIDNTKAVQGLTGIPIRLLVIGQKLASGTQAALNPVLISTADQARQFFGAGSQLAHMLAAIKKTNSFVPVYAVAQTDNGAGAAAAGSVTFGGPATSAGTINLYVAGRLVQAAVTSSQSANSIATAVAAAINANTDLPVTAAVDGVTLSKVNITARHKGVEGNYLDLRANYYSDEYLPSGVTATFVAMANGTGNPSVTAALDAIGDEWFTDIVMAYSDTTNIVAMETELATRFGPLKMIDGHCYVGLADTYANLVTKGDARNSPHLTLIGANKSPTPPYEWAAVLGVQCAYFAKQDPARPFQTLPLPGVLAPAITDRFIFEERDILLRNGISTFLTDDDGLVRMERVITAYQENPYNVDDISFLDLTTLKTLTYLRYDLRAFIALQYPRYKLADDGTTFARGQAVVTPKVIRASIIARFQLWELNGLVENIEQFKDDLIVERDGSDPNRVNALVPPNIVNGLMVFAGLVQFRL